MELLISELWAEALKMEIVNIGVLDEFYELGGDAIRAMVISKKLLC